MNFMSDYGPRLSHKRGAKGTRNFYGIELAPPQMPIGAQNRVLELDGNGSYIQLPSNIFNDLTNATIEGWVKWTVPEVGNAPVDIPPSEISLAVSQTA